MRELLAEGTCLNERYKVVRLLGEGGMGAVYLCDDLHVPGKVWALKEMNIRNTPFFLQEQALAQFKQEVQILATLNHPNLPSISHFFQHQEKYFLVMEYVEGKNLTELMQQRAGHLKEYEVTDWAVQICTVLEYLHERHIVYRDLKPSNVMLTPSGQIKLIDFGIARFCDPCKATDTFKMGSVGFSPPEQYRGRGATDARSDIYSLGATLHFLLTGRDPQEEAPFTFPPPRTLRSSLSPKIDRIVVRALEYRKENRFASAQQMKEALLEDYGLLWNNVFTRKILTSPFFARFLENPAAQRDKVALLVILLSLLAAALVVDAVKIYSAQVRHRQSRSLHRHYFKARMLENHGMPYAASEEYERALRENRRDVRTLFALACLLAEREDYDRAEELLKKGIEEDRKCAILYRELGYVYFCRNRMEDSEKALEASLLHDPSDGRTHYYMALLCERQGNSRRALLESQKCLSSMLDIREKREVEEMIRRLQSR